MMEMEKKDKILLKKEDKLLLNLMVDKSKQSFLLAIELFNKPTIILPRLLLIIHSKLKFISLLKSK